VRRVSFATIIFILAGLLGTACNVDLTPYAAKVNGTSISTSTLSSALQDAAENQAYGCLTGNKPIEGAGGSGTYSASYTAGVLTILIEDKAFSQLVKKMHLSESLLTSEVASSILANSFTSTSQSCTTPGDAVLAAFGPTFKNALMNIYQAESALALKIANIPVANGGILRYAAQHRSLTDLSCVSAIAAPAKQTIDLARAKIKGGMPFSTAASAYSDSSTGSNGGALGCFPISTLPASLAAPLQNLQVGRLSPTIAYQGQYILLEITSKQFPSELDVATQIVQEYATEAQSVLNSYLAKSQVSLPPGTGRWGKSANNLAVIVPSGPPKSLIPNPVSIKP